MSEGEPTASERLDLADWRRRIADLYADIRATAAADPAAAWRRWCSVREELFSTHPQSPVPAAARARFFARHFPYDPRLRFEAAVEPWTAAGGGVAPWPIAAAPNVDSTEPTALPPPFGGLALSLPISTGGEEAFTRIGRVTVPFPDGPRELGLYWMAGYAGGIFLPFRDATNGVETYGAGRYLLDTAKSADLGPGSAPNSLVLDFNFAFHPSCAFDPRWSCPLAPPENRLDIRVEAGEHLA